MKSRNADRPSAAAAAFERRAARADALAREAAGDEAPLLFAAGLYRAQGGLAARLEDAPLEGVLERDLPHLVPGLEEIARYAAKRGPAGLGAAVKARARDWSDVAAWWRADRSGRADYLARALIRPYAEVLAARQIRPEPAQASREGPHRGASGRLAIRSSAVRSLEGGCPFCGGPAGIALRRASGSDAGAQRFLACAICAGEWTVNRIRCPACGDESPDKLPVFQSDRHASVRIEACDGCRTYVKSIDLTEDARAIPEVDDLVSLSMDLWAAEQRYTRLEPSLAGI